MSCLLWLMPRIEYTKEQSIPYTHTILFSYNHHQQFRFSNHKIINVATSRRTLCMDGPYLKWTQVLCMIWWYILWAACPHLSRSAVVSTVRALACSSMCVNFVFVHSNLNIYIWYMVGRTGHTRTHVSCNAVSLVWGSLRLAPIDILGAESIIIILKYETLTPTEICSKASWRSIACRYSTSRPHEQTRFSCMVTWSINM